MLNEKTSLGVEYSSSTEKTSRNTLLDLFNENPIPQDQVLSNLGLFLDAKNLSRLLFLDFIYKFIVPVQGIIIDFGTRWGQNLAVFESLRSIYEPFNRHRKLVGFDTFTGFPDLTSEDGLSSLMQIGQLTTTEDYDQYLRKLMTCKEALNPLSHISKFDIRKGDATTELVKYLEENTQTIIALAFFDFDLYQPTKVCLELIKDRLTKGSILVFDELNDPDSPGETLALMKVFGLNNVELKRYPYTSRVSYFIVN